MDNFSDSVIILAAGDGSRLKSDTPKVFHKVGELCLLDHVIKNVIEISPKDVVAVIKPKYADYKLEYDKHIKKAFQNKPLGSADAVSCGTETIDMDCDGYAYILYADIPLISSETLRNMKKIANQDSDIVVLAFDASNSVGLGKLELTDDGVHIKRIVEAKDRTENCNLIPLCNAGMMVKKSVLKELLPKIKVSDITKELYITQIVELAYRAGYKCRYFEGSKNELLGVNTRADLALISQNFQERERTKHLNNGVTLVSPETVFFAFDTVIENDVIIEPYVVFKRGVHIKKGTHIESFCVLEGANVDNAKVGPFARLRSGSYISDGAKIGNFVEIKNSSISENSKINHLSYVGDSYVGSNSNIGAGTITCNYDGFKKYKTTIGNNVFIGSNSALVAPVKIDDGAIIGAGSIITSDVSENDLSVARADQRNIKLGATKFRNGRKK